MRRAEAPKPGWYPAPTGGQRLWWWDGTDWTDHQRVAPRAGRLAMAEEAAAAAKQAETAGTSGRGDSGYGVAPRLRGTGRSSSTGLSREDTTALVEEVRRTTRKELERAGQNLGDRATDVRRQIEPLISEYGTKVVRWARRAIVFGVVLWVLYLAVSGAVQAGLMSWLGDRVDNAINGTVAVTCQLPLVDQCQASLGRL